MEALRLLADGWRDRLQRLAEEVVQVQLSMLESLQVTSGVKWGDEQVDEVGRHYGLAASKVGSPVVKKLLFVLKSRWLALLGAGREEAQEAGELEGAELRMMEATMRGNAWAALKDIDAKQLIKVIIIGCYVIPSIHCSIHPFIISRCRSHRPSLISRVSLFLSCWLPVHHATCLPSLHDYYNL